MKKQTIWRGAAPAAIGLLLLTGCGGGGGSSSGDSTTGSTGATTGSTTGGSTGASLTASQQAASASGVSGAVYGAATVAALGSLSDAASITPAIEGTVSHAGSETHPTVTVKKTSGGVTVTLDYGSGITQGGVTRSGVVIVAINTSAKTASVTFQNFTVNGKTVSGTIQLTSLSYSSNRVAFASAVDLTIGGVGTIVGGESVSYASQTLTIDSANVTYTDTMGKVYLIGLSHVVIPYGATGSLLPDSGALTLSESSVGTIAVTFTANTPATKTVLVSVNGGPQIALTLS